MNWYQIITLIVSVLSLCGFGVVAKLFWEDRHRKKQENSEAAKRRAKEDRKKEVEEAISPQLDRIVTKLEDIETRLRRSERCDLAALRNSLMTIYYDCSKKGYRTEDDSKNYREMHEAYNASGGNSFIDSDVSRWFDELPLRPNEYPAAAISATPKHHKANGKGGTDK